MYVDHFNHVVTLGDPAGIFHRGRQHEQHRLVGPYGTVVEVAFHAELALGCLRYTRTNDRERPTINREFRRFGRRIVSHEHGAACLVGLHTVQEGVTPGFRRSHIDQVLDVDRGDNRVARAELFARFGLDAHTASVLQE